MHIKMSVLSQKQKLAGVLLFEFFEFLFLWIALGYVSIVLMYI